MALLNAESRVTGPSAGSIQSRQQLEPFRYQYHELRIIHLPFTQPYPSPSTQVLQILNPQTP
jgi:hypothetical protein